MNVNEALKSVKEELLNEPVVMEYFRLLSLIENDKELMDLNEDMRKHQKLMSENMDNDEIYFKEKDLYESLSKEYESNPLIVNFMQVKEEVSNLLHEIEEALQWFTLLQDQPALEKVKTLTH